MLPLEGAVLEPPPPASKEKKTPSSSPFVPHLVGAEAKGVHTRVSLLALMSQKTVTR